MPNYTENVGLRLITRPDEDNENFNTQSMLNDNWDKIDDAIGDLPSALTDMGLDEHGSVADAVNKLADFGNWYVWRKWVSLPAGLFQTQKEAYAEYNATRFQDDSIFSDVRYAGAKIVLSISDSISYSNGSISQVSPTSLTMTMSALSADGIPAATLNTLKGKYLKLTSVTASSSGGSAYSCVQNWTDKILQVPATATIGIGVGVYGSYNTATITVSEGLILHTYGTAEDRTKVGTYEIVEKPNENAFPDDGVQDGYWYEKIGKTYREPIFQIYEYVGTGTRGESNPTVWEFTHKPRIILAGVYASFAASEIEETEKSFSFHSVITASDSRSVQLRVSPNGRTYFLYSTAASSGTAIPNQFNVQGEHYTIYGIG